VDNEPGIMTGECGEAVPQGSVPQHHDAVVVDLGRERCPAAACAIDRRRYLEGRLDGVQRCDCDPPEGRHHRGREGHGPDGDSALFLNFASCAAIIAAIAQHQFLDSLVGRRVAKAGNGSGKEGHGRPAIEPKDSPLVVQDGKGGPDVDSVFVLVVDRRSEPHEQDYLEDHGDGSRRPALNGGLEGSLPPILLIGGGGVVSVFCVFCVFVAGRRR